MFKIVDLIGYSNFEESQRPPRGEPLCGS